MEIDTVLEAFKDFDKQGKREPCRVLDQLLCHVAKTGETIIPWSQFKSYFQFKLEKVMDDFRASAPEQRGLVNPNVEFIPFEEMKARILKIVDGYHGIPFTIQRLCELLTEPKRNYTGTEKFLRGVEKNVMVVSCVCPTSDRSVNGPATPRAFSRPKLPFSSSLSSNGLPDCSDHKGTSPGEQPARSALGEQPVSDPLVSEGSSPGSSLRKSRRPEEELGAEAGRRQVKRLRLAREEGSEEDEETGEFQPARTEVLPDVPESSTDAIEVDEKEDGARKDGKSAAVITPDDQEPSSTQTEPLHEEEEEEEEKGEEEEEDREASPGPMDSLRGDGATDQPEQLPPAKDPISEEQDGEQGSDPVSSSSEEGQGEVEDQGEAESQEKSQGPEEPQIEGQVEGQGEVEDQEKSQGPEECQVEQVEGEGQAQVEGPDKVEGQSESPVLPSSLPAPASPSSTAEAPAEGAEEPSSGNQETAGKEATEQD